MSDSVDTNNAASARWDDLQRQIEGLRELLVDQGTLVIKRRGQRPYWYLRYYETGPGGRKQRSLYIGGEDTARRVQALLDGFRAPGKYLQETLQLVDLARHLTRPLLRRGATAG